MRVNGSWAPRLSKEEACKFGQMAHCTRVTGRTGKQTAEDVLFTLTAMCTSVLGGKIKLMVLVYTPIRMGPGTKETGRTTSNTVRVLKPGRIKHHMRATTLREKNTALVSLLGLMVVRTKVRSSITT